MSKSERLSAASATLEPLLNYSQMAAELGVSVRTLRDYVYRGVVPCYKLGHRSVMFQKSRVQRALLRREVKAAGNGQ